MVEQAVAMEGVERVVVGMGEVTVEAETEEAMAAVAMVGVVMVAAVVEHLAVEKALGDLAVVVAAAAALGLDTEGSRERVEG